MKQIVFFILFSCVTTNVHAQCESISRELWSFIQSEDYERFDKFLMPIEQQRKILHWPASEKADKVLLKLSTELKNSLITSAKKLRISMENQGFDIKNAVFKKCEFKEKNVLTITLNDIQNEYQFFVKTQNLDKTYIVYPINTRSSKLPKTRFANEGSIADSIHINGEVFYPITATKTQKEKGLEIIQEKCLKEKKIADQKIVFVNGMKAKNGAIILTFVSLTKSNPKRYTVNLEKGSCKEIR